MAPLATLLKYRRQKVTVHFYKKHKLIALKISSAGRIRDLAGKIWPAGCTLPTPDLNNNDKKLTINANFFYFVFPCRKMLIITDKLTKVRYGYSAQVNFSGPKIFFLNFGNFQN